MSALLMILFSVVGADGENWHSAFVRGNCERDPGGCVVMCIEAAEIVAGDVAPCGGILLPDEWAHELVELRDVTLPKCRADAQRAEAVGAARFRRCDEERAALAEALRDTARELEKVHTPAKDPGWYQSPALWFSVGLVVGAVTVGAASR